MPRRGRHRTTLPVRLIAVIAALLVTGGIAVAAGSAAAKSGSGSGILRSLSSSKGDRGSDDSDSSDDHGSHDGKNDGKNDNKNDGKSDDQSSRSGKSQEKDRSTEDATDDSGSGNSGEGETSKNKDEQSKKDKASKDPFPGRDKIRPASRDDFVDITSVRADGGNIGDGGLFGAGSYSINCGTSDHNNSDNYMAAPGKFNGAQHVHDYIGNKTIDHNTEQGNLDGDPSSCTNGDDSAIFWPVLRDLNGTGPDVGKDGGSKDGNVGSILTPTSADVTFHGHPGQKTHPIPHGLMMIMGNAKAKVQGGDNADAKYTCTGFTDRVTDKYPICPTGSHLQRILDYPSCWDGRNLESKDFRQHIKYPNSDGNCDSDSVAIPQLRITLTYDQPAGRAFSIDTFPDNQHDPSTDHSDYENAALPGQAEAGANCINAGRQCRS